MSDDEESILLGRGTATVPRGSSRLRALTPERRRALALCLLLAVVYAVAFARGYSSVPQASCGCDERTATLRVPTDVSQRAIGRCVLRHKETRGLLHSELAQCYNAAPLWSMPPRSEERSLEPATPSDWALPGEGEASWAADGRGWAGGGGAAGAAADEGEAEGGGGEGGGQARPQGGGDDVEELLRAPGARYRGRVDTTRGGRRCQSWGAQSPHQHTRTAEVYPAGGLGGGHNFCRNPDGDTGPWCYTSDPQVRMEYCDVPEAELEGAPRGELVGGGAEGGAEGGAAAVAADAAAASGSAADGSAAVGSTVGSAAAAAAAAAASPKRVISYSLYGASPKYVEGAVRNAELVRQVFPGWTARFYIDAGTVPAEAQRRLAALGAELAPVDMAARGHQSMFWRFFAAADGGIERFISRDVDSRLMARDKTAVDAWVASGAPVHVVRDHPSHSRYPISGGLWGAVRGALPRLVEQVDAYPADSNYLTDMNFLNSVVWPLVNGSALQHDSFSCDVYPRARAYPVPRDAAGAHVGQVFDQDGTPRRVDVEMLLAAHQPAACSPAGAGYTDTPPPLPPRAECARLRREYAVQPGVSWGGLPAPLEPRWRELDCDSLAADAPEEAPSRTKRRAAGGAPRKRGRKRRAADT